MRCFEAAKVFMCWKKLPWVCVTFNLLYERERERGGEENGARRGKRERGGERRNGGNKRKRRRRKTVRSNFSRKITQVWEQLSVL